MNPTDRIHETNGHALHLPPKDADPVGATVSSLLRLLALGQPVSFQITLGGWRGMVEVQPVVEPAPAVLPDDGELSPENSPPMDDVILDVLRNSDKPLKITQIAQRAKVEYGSYIRERVSRLFRLRSIKKTPDHRYRIAARPADASPLADLTATDDAILEVLKKADKPIKARTIASRAGLTHNSYFKGRMARLVAGKTICKLPDYRYWLAARPLPEGQP